MTICPNRSNLSSKNVWPLILIRGWAGTSCFLNARCCILSRREEETHRRDKVTVGGIRRYTHKILRYAVVAVFAEQLWCYIKYANTFVLHFFVITITIQIDLCCRRRGRNIRVAISTSISTWNWITQGVKRLWGTARRLGKMWRGVDQLRCPTAGGRKVHITMGRISTPPSSLFSNLWGIELCITRRKMRMSICLQMSTENNT